MFLVCRLAAFVLYVLVCVLSVVHPPFTIPNGSPLVICSSELFNEGTTEKNHVEMVDHMALCDKMAAPFLLACLLNC